MDVIPIRLPKGLVESVDKLVESGDYSNRSDVVRDAVRKLIQKTALNQLIGLSKVTRKDSTPELRKLRNSLSKQIKTFKDVQKIDDLYG